ncbi:MAG: hypothetical protein ACI8RZ_002533 [Myxococcota bacterium]|jgi:hypothetical protein
MSMLLTLLLLSAHARQETYCVGGYQGDPPDLTATACNTPAIRRHHRRWHHHTYVTRDGVCYDCWDERDNSCVTDFLRDNPDYKRAYKKGCGQQDNLSDLIAHIVAGLPAGAQAEPPPSVEVPLDTVVTAPQADHPPMAGETITLTGAVRDSAGNLVPVDGGHFELIDDSGGSTTVPGTRQPDGTVTAEIPLSQGTPQVRFVPDLPERPGETLILSDDVLRLSVRPALNLAVPPVLDFGTIPAGSATRETCQRLDLTGSDFLSDVTWTLTTTGLDGCEAVPLRLVGDDLRDPVEGAQTLTLTAADPVLTFCLKVPWCASDTSTDATTLRLVPQDARFPDRAVTVPMHWEVSGKSWLRCNGVWMKPLGLVAGLLIILLGFVRPQRFPNEAAILLAGSLKGLKRATPVRLRDCPGSGPGFYRDARLGVFAEGNVGRLKRGAVVVLRATAQGVVMEPVAGLEQLDKRTSQWGAVELNDGRVMPSPRDVFRTGELIFRVEVD